MDRRHFLKTLAVAGGATAVAGPQARAAVEPKQPPKDAVGMLYDSTLCIGCKACTVACREVNGLPPANGPAGDGLYDRQLELDGYTKNVIKLWKDEANPDKWAFVKQQCMHCVDPSCASVCMLGALAKDPVTGIVTYDKAGCIGCRYCQVACPFGIPKSQWNTATPLIVKCELCKDRVAEGKQPGCCEVCPREAVIYGKLPDLKRIAHERIAQGRGKYLDHVYGETEGGGTQVLYLTAKDVPFVKLGLPDLPARAGANVSESIAHGVYQSFITPIVVYGGLAAMVWRNWKNGRSGDTAGGGEEQP